MKTALLGAVADIISGATPKTGVTEYWDGDVRWATPADLSKLDGPYISETPRTLTDSGVKSCATTILPVGSVLLSSRAPIGHVAINTVPMATNQGFKSLVPRANLDAKYLYHWLKSKTAYLQSLGNGATFKELSKKTTEQIPIPLPPLAEQRRIAAILDHADALRAKRRHVVGHLNDLLASIFDAMFGEDSWPTATLDDVSLIAGEYGANVPSGAWHKELPRYVRITDITASGALNDDVRSPGGKRGDWMRYHLADGDLLFARSGATVGKTYRYRSTDGECVFAGYLIRYRPDPEVVDPEYLFGLTKTARYASWVAARQNVVAQPNINAKQYGRELPIPLPPLDLQRAFAARADMIYQQRAAIQRASFVEDELFVSLQSRAFRGEL